jgi:hypothetical protein
VHPQDSQFLSSSFEALLYCAPLQFPTPPLPQICSTPPVQTSVGREFDSVNNLRFMVSKIFEQKDLQSHLFKNLKELAVSIKELAKNG